MADLHGNHRLDALAERVLDGSRDPYSAADELVEDLTDADHQPG
jgi:LAO/AO transport system kinase